jgi:hypothetical protein
MLPSKAQVSSIASTLRDLTLVAERAALSRCRVLPQCRFDHRRRPARFQTDSDVVVRLLDQHPAATVLEVWRGSKLISRSVRERDKPPGSDRTE